MDELIPGEPQRLGDYHGYEPPKNSSSTPAFICKAAGHTCWATSAKAARSGLVELSQEQGGLAFGPFGQHGAGIVLMQV